MSRDYRYKLSKRSSMWESTFTLPNYTRPQGYVMQEPSPQVEKTTDEIEDAVQEILNNHFGAVNLEPAQMESCLEFVSNMASSGYGLSYNKLKRMIGQWLSSGMDQEQTEYNEGYQELSFG